ncbi:hypothetical protein QQS21_002293 [Conoideocrella luteorostrata]|uniref:Cyclochlorotine biosynthesis protein O n=1 Tax=Conoideocrella luteorostrata TaxID=1105319 RepID=A0AAJ0CVN9_9HYPO|nr:hypothetical protein QQS21_002293 [Conoideocrella luteorostrata]
MFRPTTPTPSPHYGVTGFLDPVGVEVQRAMGSDSIKYSRLERADSPQSGQYHNTPDFNSEVVPNVIWTPRQAKAALFGYLILVSATIIVLTGSFGFNKVTGSQLECSKQVSPYSPVWDQVEFWEGNFLNEFNATSKYRGPPTLERERAWRELWWYHLVPVDRAGIAALNATHSGKHMEVIGSDPANPTYGASLEVFHQLHCLDLIRKYTWPIHLFNETWGDLYPEGRGEEDKVSMRMHVDHCIEALRLSLMCYVDVTPVLMIYDAARPSKVKSDFNVYHKCRDFNKIRDFVNATGIELQ